jgi:hypothetical protein
MSWRSLDAEVIDVPLVLVIQPVDEFTRRVPIAAAEFVLEQLDPDTGDFSDTEFVPARSPSGHVSFPELSPPRAGSGRTDSYRVVVESSDLMPVYPAGADGFPIALSEAQPSAFLRALLRPLPNYPYAPHLRVAHGEVRRNDLPEPGATVEAGARPDRCATDGRGRFSLAITSIRPADPITVQATARDGATASVSFPNLDALLRLSVRLDLP